MLPVLVLTPRPISAPNVGAWLFAPSMKSLTQNHGDLEFGTMSLGDEHASGGRFEPGSLFWRDVFYHFVHLLNIDQEP